LIDYQPDRIDLPLRYIAIQTLSPEICSICQGTETGNYCFIVPCGHHFHQTCLLQVLAYQNQCPNCRGSLQMLMETETDRAYRRSKHQGRKKRLVKKKSIRRKYIK